MLFQIYLVIEGNCIRNLFVYIRFLFLGKNFIVVPLTPSGRCHQ
jgi:hypothetical protein